MFTKYVNELLTGLFDDTSAQYIEPDYTVERNGNVVDIYKPEGHYRIIYGAHILEQKPDVLDSAWCRLISRKKALNQCNC